MWTHAAGHLFELYITGALNEKKKGLGVTFYELCSRNLLEFKSNGHLSDEESLMISLL